MDNKFDQEKYLKAIKICQLEQDLEDLGHNREIGERG